MSAPAPRRAASLADALRDIAATWGGSLSRVASPAPDKTLQPFDIASEFNGLTASHSAAATSGVSRNETLSVPPTDDAQERV